jgi:hypothetical protein
MAVASTNVLATEMEKVRKKLPYLYELDQAKFFSMVEKKDVETISERDMRIPLALGPGGFFGYYDPDGGDLGVGDGPSYDKAVINTNHFKLAIQWNTKPQLGTDDSRKAIINLFRELMAKAMPEFRRQTESQCMTNGTGVLATVTTLTTTTVTNDTIACTTDGYGVKLLRKGQRVNIYDSTLATNRTASGPVKILSYDVANKKVVVSATVTNITQGDLILPEGLSGANPTGLFGVPYHNSNSTSGSWLGFTRSTTPEVLSNRVNASSAALAPSFARRAINAIGDRIGEDNNANAPLKAWMHPAQMQAYEAAGQTISRIDKTDKDEGLNLFFSDKMSLAGAPAMKSYVWDRTRVDFLTMDHWGRAELQPIGFYEVDGRKIFEIRGPSGGVVTSQVFYIVASWNLFNDCPPSMSYIDNLAVPTGY